MEIWKKIDFCQNYEISNLGRVKNSKTNRILKLCLNNGQYLVCNLVVKKGISRTFYVHRIVATHFLKKVGENLNVNHLDGNRENNKVENLEWLTQKENVHHGFRYGKINRKYSEKKIALILKTRKVYFSSITQAEFMTGIKRSSISKCCNGKHTTAGGLKWEFA
jgi:hypothetical protein